MWLRPVRRLSGPSGRLAALRAELARDAAPPPAAQHVALPGTTFHIETRGCQMNVSDSEVVRALLAERGFVERDSAAAADVVLLNTCAIREGAEQKVWNRLRSLRAGGARPKKVAVLGCMAERVKSKLFDDGLADVVAGPDAYRNLPDLLAESSPAIDTTLSRVEDYGDVAPARADPTRTHGAFVSVQRGCDNNCAYCIVPSPRRRPPSSRRRHRNARSSKVRPRARAVAVARDRARRGRRALRRGREGDHAARPERQLVPRPGVDRRRQDAPEDERFRERFVRR